MFSRGSVLEGAALVEEAPEPTGGGGGGGGCVCAICFHVAFENM